MLTTIFVWAVLIWNTLGAIANLRDLGPNPTYSAVGAVVNTIFAVVAICILCGAP